MEPTAPTAALCSRHADRVAVITCARCGDYLCHDCVDPTARNVCTSCAARGGVAEFPYDREHFDFGGLFQLGFRRFRLAWLPLMGAVMLPFVGSLVIMGPFIAMTAFRGPDAAQLLAQDPIYKWVTAPLVGLVSNVVFTILLFGFLSLAAEVVWHGSATMAAWSRGARRVGVAASWAFLASAVNFAFQGVLALAGLELAPQDFTSVDRLMEHLVWLVPVGTLWAVIGAYVWLGLTFVQTELAIHPDVGILSAIVRSWRMASGFRWWLLLAWIVITPILLAGYLCCCLPIIPAAAFAGTFLTAIYFAIAPRDLPFPRA